MPESPAVVGDKVNLDYQMLIKEVFIDPIRTVVVVDDDFPTLDDFLIEDGVADPELLRRKQSNHSLVREILNFCRQQAPRPWLVDVHDGRKPSLAEEGVCATSLDHSDLLILDYHLDQDGGAEKSIEMLRKLAGNKHFNLVVVYTKVLGDAAAGIFGTFSEIALSLTSAEDGFELHAGKEMQLKRKISIWEDTQESIFNDLLDSIDETAFVKIMASRTRKWSSLNKLQELEILANYLNNIPEDVDLSADQIIQLIMHEKQKAYAPKMADAQYGRVTTNMIDDGTNWIRTDSIFITVLSKENPPESIPAKLLDALVAWDPTPHRLIMSKIRSEIAQHGIAAEKGVLENQHLQAGWLLEILENDEAKRRTKVRTDVSRHWESLGGQVEPEILAFAERVAGYLSDPTNVEIISERFDSQGEFDDDMEVSLQLNSYACSKSIEGHHLTTGHVLEVKWDKSNTDYWLCLSPACDLVPGQGDQKGWKRVLGSWLPFKAIKLFSADKEYALLNASRGDHLFMPIGDEVAVFGFSDSSRVTGGLAADAAENGAAPEEEIVEERPHSPAFRWQQFFAGNNGLFAPPNNLKVASIVGNDGSLEPREGDAKIVAQLRYEYAINLMHKLGSHLSRVGLDFSALQSRSD